VAVAVENALNFEAAKALQEELARDRDRLRLLLQVNNAIVARLETRPLFEAISGALREAL
jgi:formate hydrogenlyase transcriptional activator